MTAGPAWHLSGRERRGLEWLHLWSRQFFTRLKRRRKYLPHQQVMDPDEVDLLSALVDLEQAAGQLLAEVDQRRRLKRGEVCKHTTDTPKKRPAGDA